MGFASGFLVGQRAGEALGGAISSALQKNGIDKDVAEAMATDATKTLGGDYGKSMGLDGADQQAAQLREQDNAFGMEGAKATANALNSNTADPTQADTGGLSERYSLFGQESDKPFTKEQTDAARMSRVADIYLKHGLTEKAFALKDKIKADSRADKKYNREEASLDAAAAVKSGIAKTYTDHADAQAASRDFARFQGEVAALGGGDKTIRSGQNVAAGVGLDQAVINEATKNGASQSQIDEALKAYHSSVDQATLMHNAAGMADMYRRQAEIFGASGDTKQAEAAYALAKKENLPDAIAALKDNNIDLANQLFNNAGGARWIIKSTARDNKTGDLWATGVEPFSGKETHENISAMERTMMSAEAKAKLRETESKIGENEAQSEAARANADQSRASAGKARAETDGVVIENDYMRTHGGEKPPKAGDGKGYKVDSSEVMKQLGSPVLDERGRQQVDGNGNLLFNRNQAEERAFYTWMYKSGIKDTNEGLARWLAGERDTAMPKPAKPAPTVPFNAKAFMR